MLAMLVLSIIMIGVLAYACAILLGVIDQTNSLTRIQQDKQMLNQASIYLINHLKPLGVNGKLVAPLGVERSGHHTVPAFLGMPSKNSYGLDLIYCPFAEPISTSDYPVISVSLDESSSYTVKHRADALGRAYVYESNFAGDASYNDQDLLAFIISRRAGSRATCADIVRNSDGAYLAPNAMVKAIGRASARGATALAPVSLAASELGSSISGSDMSLLMAFWNAQRCQDFFFNIDDDSDWVITDSAFNFDFINGEHCGPTRVIITGAGGAITSISAPDRLTITLKNVHAVFQGAHFGPNIDLQVLGGKLLLKDVIFDGSILVDQASLSVSGATLSGAINLRESELVSAQSQINASASLIGSRWRIDGPTTLTHTASESLSLKGSVISQSAGSLTINSSSSARAAIELSHSQWISHGHAIVFSHGVNGAPAITLKHGSGMELDGASLTLQAPASAQGDTRIEIGLDSKFSASDSSILSAGANDTLFLVAGAMTLESSSVAIGASLASFASLHPTAQLTLQGSQIGSASGPALNAIKGVGGRFIGGAGTSIYASASCWSLSGIFSGASAISSQNPVYQNHNMSNWSCNP